MFLVVVGFAEIGFDGPWLWCVVFCFYFGSLSGVQMFRMKQCNVLVFPFESLLIVLYFVCPVKPLHNYIVLYFVCPFWNLPMLIFTSFSSWTSTLTTRWFTSPTPRWHIATATSSLGRLSSLRSWTRNCKPSRSKQRNQDVNKKTTKCE